MHENLCRFPLPNIHYTDNEKGSPRDMNATLHALFARMLFLQELEKMGMLKIEEIILVFLVSFTLIPLSISDPLDRFSEAGRKCGAHRFPEGVSFVGVFTNLTNKLSTKMQKSYGTFACSDENDLHLCALGDCHRDLSPTDCNTCMSKATKSLLRCGASVSGRIFLDGCFLRYENYEFFKQSLDSLKDMHVCQPPNKNLDDELLELEFGYRVRAVISNVILRAVKNKFAAAGDRGGVESVYAMAQCWSSVEEKDCQRCLSDAKVKATMCLPGLEGRALNTGCFLRYSTSKFYANGAEDYPHVHSTHSRTTVIIAIVYGAVAVTLLAILLILLYWHRVTVNKQKSCDLMRIPSAAFKSNLHFKYEILEKATDYFHVSRKLGQGGAGSVFLGTLPDGRTVAVKKLFFNTRQWVDEFFNEVNLISGTEHKNLVRLFGCSIEGPESLLIYEYIANGSLADVIFVNNILSWEQRYNIICGIAKGLAYLHSGCATTIIHRDIKASNILLDENFTPKIADFGLARRVAQDKSHVSTQVAGTLGYMAPEYLIRGQLTEKADVYAFGVLVVETVCGKKNTVFSQGSTSVLHCVWKNHKANNIAASVDATLHGQFSVEEASQALQIGLLCTQASIALRPSMTEVVEMLTRGSVIPSPKERPFLNASVLSSCDGTLSTISSTEPSMHTARSWSDQSNLLEHEDSDIEVTIVASEPR